MPEKETLTRARRDKRQGKAPSTQAGEFVREEIHHVREGKHGAASTKQAIAIGLSKARRAGVKLPRPSGERESLDEAKRRVCEPCSRQAQQAINATIARNPTCAQTPRRAAASRKALSRQATAAARRRSPKSRSAAARRAAQTRQRRRRAGAS